MKKEVGQGRDRGTNRQDRTNRSEGRLYGAAVVLVGAFISVALVARQGLSSSIDVSVTRALQAVAVGPYGLVLARVSDVGFSPLSQVTYAAALAGLWLAGRPRSGVLVVAATALGSASVSVLKHLVGRPRPSSMLVHVAVRLHDDGFPSGHVVHYMVMFGLIIYVVVAQRFLPSPARTALVVALGGLIVLVGPSRVYLGEHWPTDVLGGYLLGGVVLLMAIAIERRWNEDSSRTSSTSTLKRRR